MMDQQGSSSMRMLYLSGAILALSAGLAKADYTLTILHERFS